MVGVSSVALLAPRWRRVGGWLMGLSLVGFLGSAVAGAWLNMQRRTSPEVLSHASQGPSSAPAPTAGRSTAPETELEPEADRPDPAVAETTAAPSNPTETPPTREQPGGPQDPRAALREAKRVATDPDTCIDPAALSQTWRGVQAIPAAFQPQRVRVVVDRLESCRRKLEWTTKYAIHKRRVAAREAYARELPDELLRRRGIRTRTHIHGMDHERLRLGVHGSLEASDLETLIDPTTSEKLQELGFTELYISSGAHRWTHSFSPQPESELVAEALAQYGLSRNLAGQRPSAKN